MRLQWVRGSQKLTVWIHTSCACAGMYIVCVSARMCVQGSQNGCHERLSTHYSPFNLTVASLYCVANRLKWVQKSKLSCELNGVHTNH